MKRKKVAIGLKCQPFQGALLKVKLLSNIYEAVEGCLSVDVQDIVVSGKDRIMEIAV